MTLYRLEIDRTDFRSETQEQQCKEAAWLVGFPAVVGYNGYKLIVKGLSEKQAVHLRDGLLTLGIRHVSIGIE